MCSVYHPHTSYPVLTCPKSYTTSDQSQRTEPHSLTGMTYQCLLCLSSCLFLNGGGAESVISSLICAVWSWDSLCSTTLKPGLTCVLETLMIYSYFAQVNTEHVKACSSPSRLIRCFLTVGHIPIKYRLRCTFCQVVIIYVWFNFLYSQNDLSVSFTVLATYSLIDSYFCWVCVFLKRLFCSDSVSVAHEESPAPSVCPEALLSR